MPDKAKPPAYPQHWFFEWMVLGLLLIPLLVPGFVAMDLVSENVETDRGGWVFFGVGYILWVVVLVVWTVRHRRRGR